MLSNSNSNSTDTTSPPQLNLFPLRPSSVADDDNVEYLFNSAADGSATTLTSIFGAVPTSSTSSSMTSEDNNNKTNDDLLTRTALRKKERDRGREERWVCYSEVMSSGATPPRPPASEGGSGGGCGGDDEMMMKKRRRRRLELKLDYQQIMNSWGRSLIHIQMESPATVPELMNLDHHHQQQSTVMIPLDHPGGWGFSKDAGLWRVPETEQKWNNNNNNNKNRENMKIKEEGIEGGHHLREASMLRYKEKRQSRLFSKRIRYQVRKINAEKRPRLKGRFVKKS